MVVHWIREYGKGFWKHSLANILGALICYAIVLILFLFRLGDIWPFFPIIAILMWMFLKIKKHYNGVAQQLRIDGAVEEHHYQGNIVLILVGNVTKLISELFSFMHVLLVTRFIAMACIY